MLEQDVVNVHAPELIIMSGHRSNDRHKQLCGQSNSIVSGHSDRPY